MSHGSQLDMPGSVELVITSGPAETMGLSRPARRGMLASSLREAMSTSDLDRAFEVFEASRDFTAGIEEEFALIAPDSLDLVQRFQEVHERARSDRLLSGALVGELISSEVEIRSGRGESIADAASKQQQARDRLFSLAGELGIRLATTGTHPWSPWQEQQIIDTAHYLRVENGLKYVAWRNNTFGLHVHVGVRGADRAIAVCDALRGVLPVLLALSANSPYLDGRFAGLHSVRSQIFTKSFPRCGIPDALGEWRTYADYFNLLKETSSIDEFAELWWSVRPHNSFGTVEVRISDAQLRGDESLAVAALIYAAVAQATVDHDQGRRHEPLPGRLLEENLWRAIRYGLDGKLIDLPRPVERPAKAAVESLLEWTGPVRAELALDPLIEPATGMLDSGNGAQRQWRMHESGASIQEVFRAMVAETSTSYVSREIPASTTTT